MAEKQFMSANEVAAEAAIRAGMHFFAGYPITPQNELSAYLARELPRQQRTFIQAESELAAINLVLGAAAAGARGMTSSSSPGVSLMQEGISYMVGCELPGVIINTMRGGPGLGNITGSQADYFQTTRGGGHGDYYTISLAPWSVQEIAELTFIAFALAEKYRNPVMLIFDGYLGQLVENVILPEPIEVPGLEQPWSLSGKKNRPARIIRSLLMNGNELEEHNLKLQKKYKTICENEVRYASDDCHDYDLLLISFGTCARQCKEAVEILQRENIKVCLFRPITIWPFPSCELRKYAAKAKAALVVEMNYGQMLEDVRLALAETLPIHFWGRGGGNVPEVSTICRQSREILQEIS